MIDKVIDGRTGEVTRTMFCSFCSATQFEARGLATSCSAYICLDCAREAIRVIEEYRRDR